VSDDHSGSEYVHRPDNATTSAGSESAEVTGRQEDTEEETDAFGAKGWVLVGILILAVLVIPGIIYLYPTAPGEAGFSFVAAMLVLPMVPAVLLGLTAVWSMTAATGEE
jgi:uncharacterized membrane protein YdbT with pleckstrin-like domain